MKIIARDPKRDPRLRRNEAKQQPQHQRTRGFTVVEMALATTMLMVGIMAISAATLRMHQLGRQNRERTIAHNAMTQMGERLNSASAIAALSPSTWADTIIGTYSEGGAVGNTFRISGLTPVEGEAQPGSIRFLTDETLTDEEIGVTMSMPRDLNGDGDATDTDVTDTVVLLPAIITISWTVRGSNMTIQHPLFLMGY